MRGWKLVGSAVGLGALAAAGACGSSSAPSTSPLWTVGGGGSGADSGPGSPTGTTGCGGGGTCFSEDGGVGDPIPLPPNEEDGGPFGPHPVFGTTVTQAVPPPPISGGTLVVSSDGTKAWASDPDRDVLHVINLTAGTSADVALQTGDEPGRLAVDAAGHVHVVLRHGGAIASIDPVAMTVLARRTVCTAPRGIAYDATSDSLYVACADGPLVTLPATATAAATRTVTLTTDLRDVVLANGGNLYVSTLRSAQVMQIASDGTVASYLTQPALNGTPSVAWRTVALPGGGLGSVMQSATPSAISTAPGGYGGLGCGGAVTNPAIATWGTAATPTTAFELPANAMPVDIAFDGNNNAAVVFAGEWKMPGSQQIAILPSGVFPALHAADPAIPPPPPPPLPAEDGGTSTSEDAGAPCFAPSTATVDGQAVAVAYDGQGKLYVQTREPATLYVDFSGVDTAIQLSTTSRDDTGHDIFHSDQGGGIACASCHVEGGDDGRAWLFQTLGLRRTPTVLGTITGTAPYHWMGEEPDLPTLYTGALARMDGIPLSSDEVQAETTWIEGLGEPLQLPGNATSIANGQALFTSAGCVTCHSGAQFTNNLNEDAGTGGAFQVAPLKGVAWHPPYLHDGCAATLTQALDTTCAAGGHGGASTLTSAQLGDLVAYVTSL